LHENPLSFSIHSILAARLGDTTRAFGWYQRLVCRNFDGGESAPGLSLYDMGGVWLAFVKGLAGLRIEGDTPRFQPFLPPGWAAYSFKFCWRGSWLQVRVDKTGYQINEI
jgi:trehalose/maltose hydrolase-like predicted phosphorylase